MGDHVVGPLYARVSFVTGLPSGAGWCPLMPHADTLMIGGHLFGDRQNYLWHCLAGYDNIHGNLTCDML